MIHGRHLAGREWAVVLLLCLLLALAVARPLAGRLYLNTGLLQLGRAYGPEATWSGTAPDPAAAVQAETLLREALAVFPVDGTAWRGLGFALAAQGREAEARAAWGHIAGLAGKFACDGESARQAGRYDEALAWYARAAAIAPDVGEYAYREASLHDRLEEWDAAIAAYERAGDAPSSPAAGRSAAYYRAGFAFHWRFAPPRLDEALAAYDAALALDDFADARDAADAHHQRGEIYGRQGDVQSAIAEYRQAIALDPDHAWAHLRLGAALYQLDGAMSPAESEMLQALALWPDDPSRKWPYRFLADLYRQAGRVEEAIAAYRQVVRIDAQDEWAQAMLRELEQK